MATQDVRLTATNPEDSSVVPVACNEKGELLLEEPLVVEGPPGQQGEPGPPGQDGDPFSGNFASDVTFGGDATFNGIVGTEGVRGGFFRQTVPVPSSDALWTGISVNAYGGANTIALKGDGSATFAGNKAGFTAEGYLWCTTGRGDTIRLVGSSNGMALWEDYTPPSRRDELMDAWSEKNVLRPKPEESSQDEPETKQ